MDSLNKENALFLNSPLTVLKGIGPKKAELFKKLGIFSVLDLLYHLPRSYEDRRTIKKISDCTSGDVCCIRVVPLRQVVEKRLKQKLSLFLLYVTDGESRLSVKWFSAPFAKPKISLRTEYIIYGRMLETKTGREFEMRYMEKAGENKYTGVIVPVYHATSGLNSKTISDTINVVYQNVPRLPECFPEEILSKYKLDTLNSSIYHLHHPDDFVSMQSSHRRLAFEELFVLQLALFRLKNMRVEKNANIIYAKDSVIEYASLLPFELTDGQKEAINEICTDLKSGKPMNRLIQGDVGCGKTAVAAAAIYAVCKNGYQAAFMAPTEILATQHYNTLTSLFGDRVKIVLLTSSVKNKKKISEDIKNGLYDLVIGTHAVLEDKIEFNNLALSITDEQHRFGVNQRANLNSKGDKAHVLVMSATPIPRTLSLILYGDVDVSVIKTKPKGRQSVATFHIDTSKRERAYSFLRKEISKGNKCYVVCPLVEESENFDAASVVNIAKELSDTYLKGLNISVIHGKMKPQEKDEIMHSFKYGNTDVLISTTVIEVGVDVPNATVMLIENAERFGLSQLHQLRGRVGRGSDSSYCILITDTKSENTQQRMKIMTKTNDGFEISAKDLELRGSGEFFGTRQHGVPELKVANLFTDIDILKEAQEAAAEVIKKDPLLQGNEWVFIKNRIDTIFSNLDDNMFN